MLPPTETPLSRTVHTVSELNAILRALVEDSLPSLWIQGEISNFSKPASGHWYFTLKDDGGAIRCAMFKRANYYVRPVPRDGDAVLVRAKASVYPARGELQLIVEHLEPAGTGALLAAFEALKAKLDAEGLFSPTIKRPVPQSARRIGLITSGTGAALHDVVSALSRRWPLAQVMLYPVPVQGSEAAPAIVRALAELPQRAPVDVILLVRGGGSLEDLWSFNDERVARAIRACIVPVVSGVGHEIDFTIADFAADLRAPTPTSAAELVSPDITEWQARLERHSLALARCAATALRRADETLAAMRSRLNAADPARHLQVRAQRLDELDARLRHTGTRQLAHARRQFEQLRARLAVQRAALHMGRAATDTATLLARLETAMLARLHGARTALQTRSSLLASLNPQAVLERGYAIARREADGAVLREASTLADGEALRVQLARGEILARKQTGSPD
jgi:exodeoxyribonuclease VII large subunit